jgi:hypothetical protein
VNGSAVGATVGAAVGATVSCGATVVAVAHAETIIANAIIAEMMIINLFLDIGDFSC